MKLLNLTLDDPPANVALDEALLENAEVGNSEHEVLRLWQPSHPMVVLGRSSKIAAEANTNYCESANIPIVRRCSGGATILTDVGCLMYAVLLDYRQRPELRLLDQAHRFVMQKIQQAISAIGVETVFQGTCDLTINDNKVSGNALRCKKNWLIYHGTLICQNMNLRLISKCLGQPKREPDYRRGRSHAEFIAHLPITTEQLQQSLIETWKCDGELGQWPAESTNHLVETKYSTPQWNQQI